MGKIFIMCRKDIFWYKQNFINRFLYRFLSIFAWHVDNKLNIYFKWYFFFYFLNKYLSDTMFFFVVYIFNGLEISMKRKSFF